MAVESEHGSARLPWGLLHQWKASDELLLIYPSSTMFHVFPRHFFAGEEDWRAVPYPHIQ